MNRKKRSSSDLEWRSRSGRSGRSVEGVGLLDLPGLETGVGLKLIEGKGVGPTWSGGTEEV